MFLVATKVSEKSAEAPFFVSKAEFIANFVISSVGIFNRYKIISDICKK